MRWLMEALCDRERLKAGLPLTANEQTWVPKHIRRKSR